MSKLRERQGLVDLEGFDLTHETSLEGLFGMRERACGFLGRARMRVGVRVTCLYMYCLVVSGRVRAC